MTYANSAGVGAVRDSAVRVVNDFYLVSPGPRYGVVVGSKFATGISPESPEPELRKLRREWATALAFSRTAFTIHSTLFLKLGGRIALVLPTELFIGDYASAMRKLVSPEAGASS